MAVRFLICGIASLVFASTIAPVVLWFCKKIKASQSILHYVDKHASKEGTPTMGGLIFLLTLVFSSCFLFESVIFMFVFLGEIHMKIRIFSTYLYM